MEIINKIKDEFNRNPIIFSLLILVVTLVIYILMSKNTIEKFTTKLCCAPGEEVGRETRSDRTIYPHDTHNGGGWNSDGTGVFWCPSTSCYNRTTKECNLPKSPMPSGATSCPGTTSSGSISQENLQAIDNLAEIAKKLSSNGNK